MVIGTEKVDHTSVPYKPWPEWALTLFLEQARPGLRLAGISALFTGQRASDVVVMARPGDEDKAILGAYRTAIDAAPRNERLHLRDDGEPWTLAAYKTAWQRDFTLTAGEDAAPELREKAAAMKRLREAGMVFHGFRKNAVNMLLEAGCSEAEVSALVQMSEAMVRHYSRDVNRRRLAVSAMKRLEAVWTEASTSLFGGNEPPR